VDQLRYRVPNGQDTAALLAALNKEGYAAEGEEIPGGHVVVVPCQNVDRERPRVRAALQHATGPDSAYSNPGPPAVRFLDEDE